MKRHWKKGISAVLVMALLIGLLPPLSALAAASRLTITNLYTTTNAAGLPEVDGNVPRFTNNPITLTVSLENVEDSQVPNIFYEVTNMTTKSTSVEKSNKATKTGSYDITFNNVQLTEGLNKITVKMGDQSVVSSPVGWAYFTPTTNIDNLKINDATFVDNKIYPANNGASSTLNITGTAPNATEVQAYLLGDPSPKGSYFNNGSFFFVADDVNKQISTANFRLTPGDNVITFLARNSTKTYQVKRNLIYNNSNPFAFNATITEKNDGGSVIAGSTKKLIESPTVQNPNVRINALLKNDLTALGDLKYRYVDVNIGGQKFGPYDIGRYQAATTTSMVNPTTIYEGYSQTGLFLSGAELDTSIVMSAEDRNGAVVDLNAGPDTTLTNPVVNPAKTVATYTLNPGILTKANGPYKLTFKKGASVIGQYDVQVLSPVLAAAETLPSVTGVTFSALEEGYGAAENQTINLGSAVTPDKFRVDVLRLDSITPIKTYLGTGTTAAATFTFPMPTGLAEGGYKLRLSYYSAASGNYYPITEREFNVTKKDPDAPVYTSVVPTAVPDIVSPVYFAVNGTGLGERTSDITNARLTNGGSTVPLNVHYANGSTVILRLDDPSQLVNNAANYTIQFDLQQRYPDGTAYQGPVAQTVSIGGTPVQIADQVKTVGTGGYNGERVTNLYVGSTATNRQIARSKLTDNNYRVNLTGAGFSNRTLLGVELLQLNGTSLGFLDVDTVAADGTSAVASFRNLPTTAPGNYVIRVSYNNNFLGQYPLAVVDPMLTSINPTDRPVSSSTPTNITAKGTNLGWDYSKLFLKFTSALDPTAEPVTVQAAVNTLVAGSKVEFAIPALAEGAYSVLLMYDGEEVGSAYTFTVSSPPAQLREVAEWGNPGQYKVFDFTVDLAIPAERNQLITFKFYNFSTDNVPPTTFRFDYMNPNLPYVDHVKRVVGTSEIQMSDTVNTEINEQPATIKVYTNDKTNKVNMYLGEYTGNSAITMSSTSYVTDAATGKRVFSFTLNSVPNGVQRLTFIPSVETTVNTKSGESLSGSKAYGINVISTPYLIINNLYNGQVMKNPDSDISCVVGGVLKGSCISGRLINMPLPLVAATPTSDRVEVRINETVMTMNAADFDGSTFNFQFNHPTDSTRRVTVGNGIVQGKNTFKFLIYKAGVLVSESSYEIFVFSTSAPEFTYVKPVETTDIIKFVPGKQIGTYSTSENYVSFSGQFLNATEIKLTVKTKDENGRPVEKYDRRYSNFTQREPLSGNPNFFNTVNSPAGQFTTNLLALGQKGDTIFEFAITNASNVTVIETVTVTREPLPYVIVYPKLTKNSKGDYQANINSNYVEIEMIAENADSVVFGKEEANKREVIDSAGNKTTRYFYEVKDLKAGKNSVKFTVNQGAQKTSGSFDIYNADTPIEGAQYKTLMNTKIKAFDNLLELSFPKDTNLMRNEPGALDKYLTKDRRILFGIAYEDGRVDKYKHPAAADGQIGNPNPLVSADAKFLLMEPTGRFRPASQLFWIDAGTIPKNETDLNKAYTGSGQLPYDNTVFYNRIAQDLVVPTVPGQLKLKYDPGIRDDSWKYLTVYHFDISEDNRGVVRPRWRNIGGVVDPKSNTITVPFERFGYYQVMYMDQSFEDVIGHPWARNELDTLYSKGIMVNKTTSAFIPNDPISRGEFVTMLVKIFDMPLNYSENPTFTDVMRVNPLLDGLYDYKYIETAAKAGIVRGSGGGRFMPDNSITRQDAAVMIARAADLKIGNDTDKSLAALQKVFTDANSIDLYARTAVEAVNKEGFITGKENVLLQGQKKVSYRFDPLETFTRAEASAVAIRVMKQQKKVPK